MNFHSYACPTLCPGYITLSRWQLPSRLESLYHQILKLVCKSHLGNGEFVDRLGRLRTWDRVVESVVGAADDVLFVPLLLLLWHSTTQGGRLRAVGRWEVGWLSTLGWKTEEERFRNYHVQCTLSSLSETRSLNCSNFRCVLIVPKGNWVLSKRGKLLKKLLNLPPSLWTFKLQFFNWPCKKRINVCCDKNLHSIFMSIFTPLSRISNSFFEHGFDHPPTPSKLPYSADLYCSLCSLYLSAE